MQVYPIRSRFLTVVTAATNALPIQITTSEEHGLDTGDQVTITQITGNTNANGTYVVIVVDATNFTIGMSGNGIYVGQSGRVDLGKNGEDQNYDGDTAAVGEVRSLSDLPITAKCRFVAEAPTDPTGGGAAAVDVRLEGRPHANADWIEVSQIDSSDTWGAAGTNYLAVADSLVVYPEMRMRVAASGGSTNTVKAWLIL